MRRRIRSILPFRLPALLVLEAALVGLFFVQALRYLVPTLYARIGSASLFPALDPGLVDPTLPGLVEPATISAELSFFAFMLALPLLQLLTGRLRWMLAAAAIITALGRYLMAADITAGTMNGAALTVGGGLLYLAFLTRHRARMLPYMFILALAADQLYRAVGDTLDPSWSADYLAVQLVLSIIVGALSIFTVIKQTAPHRKDDQTSDISHDQGILSPWSGIGLGGLLFLQLSLLALPNAAAGRAGTDYTPLVPLMLLATLLPIIPWVQDRARKFIGLFDSSVRGWSWMLVLMLLLVFGTRFQGIIAAAAMVLSQFSATMLWWWLVRPQAARERNFSGLWIVTGTLIFGLLVGADIFTYEYAFVRDFSPELAFLNDIIPPLLRGFRGLGLGVLLLAAFLAAMPMAQTQRRIAWSGGQAPQTAVAILLTASMTVGGAFAAQPPVVASVSDPDAIRVGTYNIHAGFNEFFHYDIEAIAQTIQRSGANVVLLQEIETGRMTSYGVDQALWLGRRLGMDRRFYGTNEGLQGLAVLSNIEIVFDDGVLLDGTTIQTGLQRVQVRPDAGVITIYNIWLDPLLDTSAELTTDEIESSQQQQLSQIFSIITAQHPPDGQLGRTVIGGTFNNVPGSDLIQRMTDSGFTDHFAGIPLELSATFWRTGQRARLDYVWTTRLQVTQAGVINTNASDHRLAVIEIQLQQ